jgi:hypothetical protein
MRIDMEWISVKDRLPEKENEEVICYDGKIVFTGVEYSKKNDFEWIECGYKPKNITHWMPLPNPPQK